MIGYDELKNRFTYHKPPDPGRVAAHVHIRESGLELAEFIDNVVPDGREKSLSITKIEEAVFWANAGLARHGAIGEETPGDNA
jgi:hypothetical protein